MWDEITYSSLNFNGTTVWAYDYLSNPELKSNNANKGAPWS